MSQLRRVDWDYYNKLMDSLIRAGVDEDAIPLDFALYHWQDKVVWLHNHYPSLFLCPCCKHLGEQMPAQLKCMRCAGVTREPKVPG
jgi:hypothetical protein